MKTKSATAKALLTVFKGTKTNRLLPFSPLSTEDMACFKGSGAYFAILSDTASYNSRVYLSAIRPICPRLLVRRPGTISSVSLPSLSARSIFCHLLDNGGPRRAALTFAFFRSVRISSNESLGVTNVIPEYLESSSASIVAFAPVLSWNSLMISPRAIVITMSAG